MPSWLSRQVIGDSRTIFPSLPARTACRHAALHFASAGRGHGTCHSLACSLGGLFASPPWAAVRPANPWCRRHHRRQRRRSGIQSQSWTAGLTGRLGSRAADPGLYGLCLLGVSQQARPQRGLSRCGNWPGLSACGWLASQTSQRLRWRSGWSLLLSVILTLDVSRSEWHADVDVAPTPPRPVGQSIASDQAPDTAG